MYCNHCQRDMPNDFKLCPVCGNPPSGSPQAPPQPPPQYNAPPQPPPQYNAPPPNPPNYNPYPPRQPNPQSYASYKSEGTTLVLSIVLGLLMINGVGHLYVSKIGKGVAILIGSIILAIAGFATLFFGVGVILLIIYFIIFIWQIVDSRKLCQEYNNYLLNNGRPPW